MYVVHEDTMYVFLWPSYRAMRLTRPTLKVSLGELLRYPRTLQTPSRMSLKCKIEDQESATEPPNKEGAGQSGSGTSCDAIARPGDRGGQRVV